MKTDLKTNCFPSGVLVCPVCGAALEENEKTYVCEGNGAGKRHCFDRGASGYVNFAFVRGHGALSGDPPEAVRARSMFLNSGYYKPAADMLLRIADEYVPSGLLVDAGCGEGYYSVYLASSRRAVLGVDLSKYAADRAAKRANVAGKSGMCRFAAASIYELPLADSSADAVVCMFSPCAEQEYTRVLKPGGVLITGSAGERHLYGLKKAIYDTPTLNEPRADLPRLLAPAGCEELEYPLVFSKEKRDDISRLFDMTPYKYRTSSSDLARLAALDSLECEAHFEFRVYQKTVTAV